MNKQTNYAMTKQESQCRNILQLANKQQVNKKQTNKQQNNQTGNQPN